MEKLLKGTPAQGFSRADLMALAGAKAVAVCGGPSIPVLVGRVDATGPDPANRLPGGEWVGCEQVRKEEAQ